MSDIPQTFAAIPTLYSGVQFKSRLEARFAEYLDAVPTHWEYERPFYENSWASIQGKTGSYRPDFWLGDLHLYVEIKPKSRLSELELFKQEIYKSEFPWICVDKFDRDLWSILDVSPAFSGALSIHSPGTFVIKKAMDQKNRQRIYLICGSVFLPGAIV